MKILSLLVLIVKSCFYLTLLDENTPNSVERPNNSTKEKLQKLKIELQTWSIDSVSLRKKIEEESAQWRKELLTELRSEELNQVESQWGVHFETIKSTIIQVQQDKWEDVDASMVDKWEWMFKSFFRKIFKSLWLSKFWMWDVWDGLADSTSSTLWWWITWFLAWIPLIWKFFKKNHVESTSWLWDDIKKSMRSLSNFPSDKIDSLPFVYNKNFVNDKDSVLNLKSFLDKVKSQETIFNDNKAKSPSLIESDVFWTSILWNEVSWDPFTEQLRQKVKKINESGTTKLTQEEFYKKLGELSLWEIKKTKVNEPEVINELSQVEAVVANENENLVTPSTPPVVSSDSQLSSVGPRVEVPHKTLQQQVTEWIVDRFFLSENEHMISFDGPNKRVNFDWRDLPIRIYYKFFWSYKDSTNSVMLTDLSLNWVKWSYDIVVKKWDINFNFSDDDKIDVLTQLATNWKAKLMEMWEDKDIWIEIW